MINFVCTLKMGGDFDHRHVLRLGNMISDYTNVPFEFSCITDNDQLLSGRYGLLVNAEPLAMNLPGWWSKLEMFRAIGSVIHMDIDVTIIDTLDPLIDAVVAMGDRDIMLLRPWNTTNRENGVMATGVTAWNGDNMWFFDELIKMHKNDGIRFDTTGRVFLSDSRTAYKNDQHCITERMREAGKKLTTVQDMVGGSFVQSFKRDLARGSVPARGSIVMFHGKPRPWEVPA